MSTQDVPGANPANADVLAMGSWAEHDDGSLIFVQSVEADQVVYQIFDVAQDPAVYYQDAMRVADFKKAFSHPPTGNSSEKWKWHDKSIFPWSRVMKTFDKPRPVHADVHEELSAAARVAKSLRLRSQRLAPEDVKRDARFDEEREERGREQTVPKGGRSVVERIQRAISAFCE